MRPFPFFSVVIPTYNRAHLIEKTLQSVWAQTYPHYELIVVDNCSADNTDEVLAPYVSAGRLRFIKHDRNYGVARSRNSGMAAATGDFLTLLDSDDLMYPRNLEDAAQYIHEHPHTKCFQNVFEFVDEAGKFVYSPRFPSLKDHRKAISKGNFMSCIGDFIHRDLYKQYEFDTDPRLTGGEDWDFWIRVLADFEVGRINKINSGVVQHEGRSVLNQDISKLERGLEYLVDKIFSDPHLTRIYTRYRKHFQSSAAMYLAILANDAGEYRRALGYLRTAIGMDMAIVFHLRFLRIFQLAFSGAILRSGPLADSRND